jgi:hypothetical protein
MEFNDIMENLQGENENVIAETLERNGLEFQGDKEFFQEVEDFRQEIAELQERHDNEEELSQDETGRLMDWRIGLLGG